MARLPGKIKAGGTGQPTRSGRDSERTDFPGWHARDDIPASGYDHDLATVKAVRDNGGGGGAVTSVNGQTGDVVLDASDVGALATVATDATLTGDGTTGDPLSVVGGGGGSLTVTDGTTTVNNVSEIQFTKASSVTDLTGGVVEVNNDGGGSGGGPALIVPMITTDGTEGNNVDITLPAGTKRFMVDVTCPVVPTASNLRYFINGDTDDASYYRQSGGAYNGSPSTAESPTATYGRVDDVWGSSLSCRIEVLENAQGATNIVHFRAEYTCQALTTAVYRQITGGYFKGLGAATEVSQLTLNLDNSTWPAGAEIRVKYLDGEGNGGGGSAAYSKVYLINDFTPPNNTALPLVEKGNQGGVITYDGTLQRWTVAAGVYKARFYSAISTTATFASPILFLDQFASDGTTLKERHPMTRPEGNVSELQGDTTTLECESNDILQFRYFRSGTSAGVMRGSSSDTDWTWATLESL